MDAQQVTSTPCVKCPAVKVRWFTDQIMVGISFSKNGSYSVVSSCFAKSINIVISRNAVKDIIGMVI